MIKKQCDVIVTGPIVNLYDTPRKEVLDMPLSDVAGATAPQRQPTVISAIAALEDRVAVLDKKLATLKGRLDIVSSPPNPTLSGDKEKTDLPVTCELEARINGLVKVLEEYNRRITEMYESLEI